MSNPFVRAASSAFKLTLLPLALVAMAVPNPSRRLGTQAAAAAENHVTTRTVRNWISKGLIHGYRLPGGRGIRVDLDEIQRVMRIIPTTVARPGNRVFGPRAKIVDLPVRAEVVPSVTNLPVEG